MPRRLVTLRPQRPSQGSFILEIIVLYLMWSICFGCDEIILWYNMDVRIVFEDDWW